VAQFLEWFCIHTNQVQTGVKSTLPLSNERKVLVTELSKPIASSYAPQYTTEYTVSDAGKAAVQKGLGGTLIIDTYLGCQGSFSKGVDGKSGSNCKKQDRKPVCIITATPSFV
jgi:hypothetical protein